ncbi:methyl-accepting chemotaxis protein [Clostridium beijerinckii]|jgi:Methyl-accepting chemotaxis protein|uniref:Methyl-accepting chemotaxis protein n=2 Tax=Clostridium beijerinckii TaxID=1520 RepID=A0A1S8QT90_CLOBE|nr:methyl-accepting chemotaxis protein [Clostridium beijerinckii]ABR35184.1 methyl-accepting chemotaxis sensory transducer [Clostridium beijerinckii NCIMB 8052]AIU02636.1 methyl-accepting chemotaxis sensory transducer [Clostridium beijerinckii ATCC 35702]MBF7810181.1 methyl-accepting chemotaxis protein [Clostridium beijerinckii]NOW90821.1 methyl-accepting chemotaxis protein [Clostridium beijerinckii]NRT23423.1 methyl-accepting chemotaxis protein [Clostridium beijerinckii]
MTWLNNLKVGRKLAILIICSLVGLFAVGITGYYFLQTSSKSMEVMYSERLLSSEWLSESRVHARAISADIFRIMVTTDKNENSNLTKDINTRAEEFNNYMALYKKLKLDDFEADKVSQIDSNLAKYREGRKVALDLANENKNQEAYEYYEKNVELYADAFLEELVDLGEHNRQIAEKINAENKANFKIAVIIFSSIVAIASILIILLGILITKRITKRLNDFVVYIGSLSQGDFSVKIKEESLNDKSEFGVVSNAIDKMTKNIIELIKQLGNTSEQLVLSSEELTASAEQSADASNLVASAVTTMAHGADEQFSFANSTNKVVENISNKINVVSENTKSVSSLTDKAKISANAGEDAVVKAMNQMEIIEKKTSETSHIISELEEKSVKIGQILDTIQGISEQTNLLALNAAIESARAGEAGKGFSVVAEEIRKLAEQSQEATKEIAGIINDVQNKTNSAVAVMNENSKEVKTGADVVDVAGISFKEILQMIIEISSQIHEISDSITEVTVGTKESVDSVNNIKNISSNIANETQTISAAAEEQLASVEEIASSSKLLSQMSEELRRIIAKFKI